MLGKKKCKMLREIRQKIASENDIPFVTEECKYKGDCKGTCPKCESELRYLEEQLEKRRSLGKKVTVSALAASLLATAAGCRSTQLAGDVAYTELDGDVPYTEVLEGEVAETECDVETETEEAAAETTEAATEGTDLAGMISADEESATDG